jgi:integrase
MAENLTKTTIQKFLSGGVPDGKSQTVLWDGAVIGLGLRLRLGGAASWMFTYRPKGASRTEPPRRVTLGQWPGVTLDAARTAARVKAGEVASGRDPAAELRDERNRERRVVAKALDDYEQYLQREEIVNAKAVMSTLRRGLAPFAAREISALTRKDLVEKIEALENAGKPGAATDLRSHARAWLEWAVSGGLIQFNVMSGLRRPRSSRAKRLREESKAKALSDEEIVALWSAAGTRGVFGGMLRLGLLTGMRRDELAGLCWNDVHDDRIVLGPDATKNGKIHEISLTSAMRAVLTAQPRTASDLVFPSSRTGSEMAGWTGLVDAANARSGVAFKLHDLRRTVRTLMSRLGVAEDIAELAIGHVRKGLVATYNKDDAWAARVSAFERVSAHVAGLVSGVSGAVNEGEHGHRVVALGGRR